MEMATSTCWSAKKTASSTSSKTPAWAQDENLTLISESAGEILVDNLLGINGFSTPSVLDTDDEGGSWSEMNWGTSKCLTCPSIPWRMPAANGPKSPTNGTAGRKANSPPQPWKTWMAMAHRIWCSASGMAVTLWHAGAEDAVRGCSPS